MLHNQLFEKVQKPWVVTFSHSHGINTPATADMKLQTLTVELERDSNNHLRRAGGSSTPTAGLEGTISSLPGQ